MITKKKLCDSISANLREFGYPDVTSAMIEEIRVVFATRPNKDTELPHGVIGMFVERQFEEIIEAAAENNLSLGGLFTDG